MGPRRGIEPPSGEPQNFVFIVYTAKVQNGEPKAGDDVKELMILDPMNAYNQFTGKFARKAVVLWLNNPKH